MTNGRQSSATGASRINSVHTRNVFTPRVCPEPCRGSSRPHRRRRPHAHELRAAPNATFAQSLELERHQRRDRRRTPLHSVPSPATQNSPRAFVTTSEVTTPRLVRYPTITASSSVEGLFFSMKPSKRTMTPSPPPATTSSKKCHTPSLPVAFPRSDRFRCGGRESKFLAVRY